jgi:hypothetical protein
MSRRQRTAGHLVGVVHLDEVWYPLVPGNVVNASTFGFPVRYQCVEGVDIPALFGPARRDVSAAIISACQELEGEGVRAISSACGYFGFYQRQVAQAVNVPVGLSSLVQIPWVASLIGPSRGIAVLTADATALEPELWEACGIHDQSRLVVGGLQEAPEFSAILEGRGEFNNEAVRDEAVALACRLTSQGNVGAVLLECSDLPPYSAAIQAAVGLPVFDFTTLIRFLHSAVAQQPYGGFI